MDAFFSCFEGGVSLLIIFVITGASFLILLMNKLPKARPLFWVIYVLALIALAFAWKRDFFPGRDPDLSNFLISVLIGFVLFIFSSTVYLVGEKDKEQFFKKVGGIVMLVSGVAIIAFTLESISFSDNRREENYQKQLAALEASSSNLKQEYAWLFPDETPRTAIVVPGSSLCYMLGVSPQEALKLAKANKLKYHWYGHKLFVLVYPGDQFTQVGVIWILNRKK